MSDQRVKSIIIDATFGDIVKAYCEDVENIPTDKAKAYFHEWNEKVPGKLLRQCIFAAVFWAHSHPETVTIVYSND